MDMIDKPTIHGLWMPMMMPGVNPPPRVIEPTEDLEFECFNDVLKYGV